MTCCAIRGAKALRTPPTKCAGRALFDEDATPCAPSVLFGKQEVGRISTRKSALYRASRTEPNKVPPAFFDTTPCT